MFEFSDGASWVQEVIGNVPQTLIDKLFCQKQMEKNDGRQVQRCAQESFSLMKDIVHKFSKSYNLVLDVYSGTLTTATVGQTLDKQ